VPSKAESLTRAAAEASCIINGENSKLKAESADLNSPRWNFLFPLAFEHQKNFSRFNFMMQSKVLRLFPLIMQQKLCIGNFIARHWSLMKRELFDDSLQSFSIAFSNE
jgi:hypothetical protein